MTLHQIFQDGGWQSRKLAFGTLIAVLIFAGACWVGLDKVYTNMVDGLLWTFGIFAGANVGGKLAIGKAIGWSGAPDAPPDSTTPPAATQPEAPVTPAK